MLIYPPEIVWENLLIHLVNGAGVAFVQAVALLALDWRDAP